jgi:nicotinamidase-related amidase
MSTTLLVMDMHKGMQRRIDAGRDHVNPDAPARIADLLALFRSRGLPVVHVHHADPDPTSPFHPGHPDHAIMAEALPCDGEAVIVKSGSSAFIGTGLEAHLVANHINTLVVVGAVAAFCITSTVRQASDLGFKVLLPGDALMGFDIPAHDTGRIPAADVLRVTLSLLGADFATLTRTDAVSGFL